MARETTPAQTTACPGCGLELPVNETARYDGYYHVSSECWELYTRVLDKEFGNILLFRQIHQLTVDTYAVQHAGGSHKDQSVDLHLAGLYLMMEKNLPCTKISRIHQLLSRRVKDWPHFKPPVRRWPLTIRDVRYRGSMQDHIRSVNQWAHQVWDAWAPLHPQVEDFVSRHLTLP